MTKKEPIKNPKKAVFSRIFLFFTSKMKLVMLLPQSMKRVLAASVTSGSAASDLRGLHRVHSPALLLPRCCNLTIGHRFPTRYDHEAVVFLLSLENGHK